MKLYINSQTTTVSPLNIGNGYVISAHALLDMLLLIHARIKVNHVSKRGPWCMNSHSKSCEDSYRLKFYSKQPIGFQNLHMSRQLSCRDMYKIVTWSNNYIIQLRIWYIFMKGLIVIQISIVNVS